MKEKLVIFTNERDARRFFLQRRTPCLILLLLLLIVIVSVLLAFCSAPRVPLAPITRAPSLTPTIVPATDLPTRTLVSWTPTNTPTNTPTPVQTPTETPTNTRAKIGDGPVTASITPSITPTVTDTPMLTPTETRVTIPAGRPSTIPTTGRALTDFRLWFVFGALCLIAGALLYWNSIVRYMIMRAYARKFWRK